MMLHNGQPWTGQSHTTQAYRGQNVQNTEFEKPCYARDGTAGLKGKRCEIGYLSLFFMGHSENGKEEWKIGWL